MPNFLKIMVNINQYVKYLDTCGERHQTPFKNQNILWVVQFRETL